MLRYFTSVAWILLFIFLFIFWIEGGFLHEEYLQILFKNPNFI